MEGKREGKEEEKASSDVSTCPGQLRAVVQPAPIIWGLTPVLVLGNAASLIEAMGGGGLLGGGWREIQESEWREDPYMLFHLRKKDTT